MTLIIGRPKDEMQSRTTTIRSAFRKIRTDRLCAELYHAQNGLCLICWHPLNEWGFR